MLVTKYDEIVTNPLGLDEYGPKMTVETHQNSYRGYVQGYDNMVSKWSKDNCPGGPPPLSHKLRNVPKWDQVRYPKKAAPTPFAWIPLAGIVASPAFLYIAYRVGRTLIACGIPEPGEPLLCAVSVVSPT
jgi:hypothetical protein